MQGRNAQLACWTGPQGYGTQVSEWMQLFITISWNFQVACRARRRPASGDSWRLRIAPQGEKNAAGCRHLHATTRSSACGYQATSKFSAAASCRDRTLLVLADRRRAQKRFQAADQCPEALDAVRPIVHAGRHSRRSSGRTVECRRSRSRDITSVRTLDHLAEAPGLHGMRAACSVARPLGQR